MDFVEARKPAGSNLSRQDKQETVFQQTFRDRKKEMERPDASARQRSHSRIRSVEIPESGEELGPAARQREAAPLPRDPAAKPRLRACLARLPVNSNTHGPWRPGRWPVGSYVARPDSVIVPSGPSTCTLYP